MRECRLRPRVALCHREELDPGPSGDWTQLNDDDFRALASRLSDEADEGPLWVFAYGSLIWKPALESIEQRRASAYGWHRSFCLDMVRWRGSAAQPGLMMLERGGFVTASSIVCRTARSPPRSRDCCGEKSTIMKASARSGGFRYARRKDRCGRWVSGSGYG